MVSTKTGETCVRYALIIIMCITNLFGNTSLIANGDQELVAFLLYDEKELTISPLYGDLIQLHVPDNNYILMVEDTNESVMGVSCEEISGVTFCTILLPETYSIRG